MSAPSPAPWVARNFADDSFGEIHDANGLWVARVHSRNGNDATDPECVANASLMASSPALLAALERVGCQDAGSCGPTEPDGLCFVCAAIAQGRGLR